MKSIMVCEYSRSRSFHNDLILQSQASGERSQDHWSSGFSGSFSIRADKKSKPDQKESQENKFNSRRHRNYSNVTISKANNEGSRR